MGITWTKDWSSADDGTTVDGADLENIQSDIDSEQGNATTIQSYPVESPTAGDDGKFFFWDNSNSKYDYKDLSVPGAIGATTPSTGAFTTLSSTGQASLNTLEIGGSGAIVTTIENSDTLGTSDTKLCTQGNVKAYVDNNTVVSQVFTESGTFIVPSGVTEVILTMVGGGGGGGGSNTGANSAGGGGGAGEALINKIFTVTPEAELTVTVGNGGTCPATTSDGNVGETTSFDSVSVAGGAAGIKGPNGAGGVGAGSSIDASGLTPGSGSFKGGDGETGSDGSYSGGGGGTYWGAGGAGKDAEATGEAAGANTGAGGGGGYRASTQSHKGGAGGSGFVIVSM